jgi:hypothetical protein
VVWSLELGGCEGCCCGHLQPGHEDLHHSNLSRHHHMLL